MDNRHENPEVLISSESFDSADESRVIRLKKYAELLQGYYRSGEVDKDRLVELVTRAKGKRSMRAFAEDMGMGVASVSRLLNGKVTEVRDATLIMIAANADPESGVTLEKLLDAQGMVRIQDRSEMGRKYEEDCRRIMADDILNRGYSVTYEKQKNSSCDFLLRTDAIKKGGGLWFVECKMTTLYSRQPVGVRAAHAFLNEAMAFYYKGGRAGRISLIVDHNAVFEQMKRKLSDATIPDEISVMLISTAQRKILNEYVAPLSDGSKADSFWEKE